MRALTLTAVVVLLATADGAAMAQSCGKGMLWPYVRQPGDCLTDQEIRAGQRGVYNGPVNTNPDLSAIRPDAPAAQTGPVTGTSGPLPQTAGGPQSPAASAPTLNGAGFSFTQNAAASGPCKKGWLWPFVRSPGDCLTNAERGNGETGVYRASEVVVASVESASGSTAVNEAGAPSADGGATATADSGSAEPACRKGWLWPFVRRPGDCPTAAERR